MDHDLSALGLFNQLQRILKRCFGDLFPAEQFCNFVKFFVLAQLLDFGDRFSIGESLDHGKMGLRNACDLR